MGNALHEVYNPTDIVLILDIDGKRLWYEAYVKKFPGWFREAA